MVDYEDFFAIGDDYGQVTVICKECRELNTPYKNMRQMRVGVADNDTVAAVMRICAGHVHQLQEPK